jgi:hypothetical protein
MRILADENIDQQIVRWLRERGHDARVVDAERQVVPLPAVDLPAARVLGLPHQEDASRRERRHPREVEEHSLRLHAEGRFGTTRIPRSRDMQ